MTLWLAILIVIVATSASVALMLFVRRRAPDGSYFVDGDRAAGVFGILATGFAVLIGFVVFLAFTSYDEARSGAETEARIVAQQLEIAQLFPPEERLALSEQLYCYARSVAGVQWERLEDGTIGEELNPWGVELFQTLQGVDPQTPSEQAAYGKWLDQTADREEARSDRIHGAVGVIPLPLWLVLFFTTIVVVCFLLFFADSGEGRLVQAMLMGSVVAVMVSMLLLLQFLNHPFHGGIGGLKPVAMERTITIMDEEFHAAGITIDPPCDAEGNPL